MMKQEQIEGLTQKLLNCGYRPSQIREIISDAIGSDTTANNDFQEQLIIDALESYVSFATKCQKICKHE
jgi:hypothetical protein